MNLLPRNVIFQTYINIYLLRRELKLICHVLVDLNKKHASNLKYRYIIKVLLDNLHLNLIRAIMIIIIKLECDLFQ